IRGLSAEDFPLIPKIEEKPIAVFKKSEILKTGLTQVVCCAAISEARPEFSGVLFQLDKDMVRFVATDSFRLAEKTIFQSNNLSQSTSLVIPQRTIQELIKILGEKAPGEVRFILGDSQVLFELDDVQLISRVIDAQYPDYQQIIPKSFQTQITVSREELVNNIRIASIFSSKINDIKFSVKQGKLEILSQDPDLGEHRSQISGQVSGQPLEIIFNFRYLIEGLTNISTKQVLLGLNEEAGNTRSNPAVVKPVGEDGYIYVVMPIKTT
ncbi:MAG: DNA polymerase III subunit beta, partial [Candidatus Portnoybacteria bacterium RBG_13_41_18]